MASGSMAISRCSFYRFAVILRADHRSLVDECVGCLTAAWDIIALTMAFTGLDLFSARRQTGK
jgi:hypothetical protein